MSQTLQLRYAGIAVGVISKPFCSDNTWFGLFHETLRPSDGITEKRLHDYIAFSEEWHVRCKAELPADGAEFDAFLDLFSRWQTVDSTRC